MTTIGIDCDGVVYDFQAALRDYICAETKQTPDKFPPAESWEFFVDQWGLTYEDYAGFISRGIANQKIFWQGTPIPGAIAGVTALFKAGYTINFITARGGFADRTRCQWATASWLDEWGFPYHDIIYSEVKTLSEIDVLLDDAPQNYLDRINKGMKAVVFDQPWNRHLTDAVRVNGWSEAVQYFVKEFPVSSCVAAI